MNTPSPNHDVQAIERRLADLSQQMAARFVQASADDLPLLSRLHEDLESFAGHLAPCEQDLPWASAGLSLSAQGKALVEQIILHEAPSADAALAQVGRALEALQQLLDRAAPGLDAAEPSAPQPAGPGSETHHDASTGGRRPLAPDSPPERTPCVAAAASIPTDAAADATHPAPVAPGAAAPAAAAAPTPAATAAPSLINPEDLPLLQEFVTEAYGHLDSAEAALLQLGDNPDDLEAVNAVFRAFHTLKGVAGLLGLKAIGALAHVAESMLDLARKGELELGGDNIDLVLEARDAMKGLIDQAEQAAARGTLPPADAGLDDLTTRLSQAARRGDAPSPSAPPAATPAAASAPAKATQEPAAQAASPGSAATADQAQIEIDRRESQRRQTPDRRAAGQAESAEATVKVTTDKLDRLINMVGELMIAQSMVRQDLSARAGNDPRTARNSAQLGKITRDLQDLAMSMRMVPIQGVFQKMARLVRDLARRNGKQVDLQTEGAQTELDRNVVEAISDPLVHMVRNAVDHGIESPERRAAAGKARTGRLNLRACHLAGNIVISISDDGQGLRADRILAKAQQAGLVRKGQEISEQEIYAMIFHPGLSTAETLTDISGRGVGMDVVRKNVEALRGRVDIASTPGKGACFTVRLPLTLAVIDGLVVRVGPSRYILPLTSIEQSIRPKPGQVSTIQGRGEICSVRESLVPVVRLHRLFDIQPASDDPTKGILVLVHDGRRRCCLLVDELLGQQEVVIKSLGEGLGSARGVSGGAILGDGSISLILDVPGLIQTREQT